MRILRIMFIIAPFLSLSVAAVPTIDNTELFSNSMHLVHQQSCFSGDTASYEAWVNFYKKRGMANVNRIVSKDTFEHYKATVECYSFIYNVDGVRVKGYVVKPKTEVNLLQRPVIIYNRGGNNVSAHTLNLSSLFRYHMPLAAQGYIVISSQYRGAKVWPASTKHDTGQDEFGGKDLDDVLALYPIIKGMHEADTSRIGMFGWSRGGMMTYLALKESSWIKAAAVGGAPTDLVAQVNHRPEMEKGVLSRLIPNYFQNKEQELKARSAIYWPEKLAKDVPILILHGGEDSQVTVSDSSRLAEKLEEYQHPYKLIIVPGASHGIREQPELVLTELINWFDKYL